MQQIWKKDFTSNEKCPCTCTEKNGFERLDSTIFEFYIFFIIKSHNFSSKLRGTWNVNIITKVRSYLFWRYSLKNDWLFFFLRCNELSVFNRRISIILNIKICHLYIDIICDYHILLKLNCTFLDCF